MEMMMAGYSDFHANSNGYNHCQQLADIFAIWKHCTGEKISLF